MAMIRMDTKQRFGNRYIELQGMPEHVRKDALELIAGGMMAVAGDLHLIAEEDLVIATGNGDASDAEVDELLLTPDVDPAQDAPSEASEMVVNLEDEERGGFSVLIEEGQPGRLNIVAKNETDEDFVIWHGRGQTGVATVAANDVFNRSYRPDSGSPFIVRNGSEDGEVLAWHPGLADD